jgi:hypothetical protein
MLKADQTTGIAAAGRVSRSWATSVDAGPRFGSGERVRRVLIRSLILLVALSVVWFAAGRQLTMLLDRFLTVQMAVLPTTPLTFGTGQFIIGGMPMSTMAPGFQPLDISFHTDQRNQLLLSTRKGGFSLGTATSGSDPTEVVPDPADRISFVMSRSLISWPVFEFNFMTGHAPSKKRNFYYRLIWRKPSGETLDAVWRFEQWFYSRDGWASDVGTMTNERSTGLIRLDLRAE